MLNTQITHLEELSLNAWPGHQTLLYDGWLLRFAGGYTRRANAVHPLYESSGVIPLEEKIKSCEEIYASKGLPVIFKLTPACRPPELDQILAARGYSQFDLVSVQTAALAAISLEFPQSDPKKAAETEVFQDSILSQDWLPAWLSLSNTAPDHFTNVEKLLSNIGPDRCFMRLERAGQPVAAGLAVYERGHVGLFDIVTDINSRRQGLGKRLVIELLRWGKSKGADTSYLQVLGLNTPAVQLYSTLGYKEVYKYWYRIKPV